MFRLIKKAFIALLILSRSVATAVKVPDHTKGIYLDHPFITRSVLINEKPVE